MRLSNEEMETLALMAVRAHRSSPEQVRYLIEAEAKREADQNGQAA